VRVNAIEAHTHRGFLPLVGFFCPFCLDPSRREVYDAGSMEWEAFPWTTGEVALAPVCPLTEAFACGALPSR